MMVLDLQLCETPRTPENELAKAAVGEEAMTPTPTPEGLYYLPVEEIGSQPVDAGQKGEGWPYAPEGWPTPDDKWTWRVGRRRNSRGFWQDRYLILPKRLQKGSRKVWFFSKKAVQDYLTREFPDTDLDRFFASFQWDVPCTPEGKTTFCGKRGREAEEDGNVAGQEKICKAGNPRCGLETGKSNSLKAMNCDICCIEFGFCRECSCILCGKVTDQSVGEFSSIRCEGKLNEEFVCGHVSHLECALLCHMAGVEKSVGLDMEYYCRRCDKKTDLMMHIEGLIHASGSLNIRADVEKNLNLALRITQGTRQTAGRSLQKIINSALEKLHSGMNVEDIVELQQNSVAVNAVDVAEGDDAGVTNDYLAWYTIIRPRRLTTRLGPGHRQMERILRHHRAVSEQSGRGSTPLPRGGPRARGGPMGRQRWSPMRSGGVRTRGGHPSQQGRGHGGAFGGGEGQGSPRQEASPDSPGKGEAMEMGESSVTTALRAENAQLRARVRSLEQQLGEARAREARSGAVSGVSAAGGILAEAYGRAMGGFAFYQGLYFSVTTPEQRIALPAEFAPLPPSRGHSSRTVS